MDTVRSWEFLWNRGVKVTHHRIPRKITADDRPAFDTDSGERVDDGFPAAGEGAFEYQGKSEPTAAAHLTLHTDSLDRGHSVEEERRVGAAGRNNFRYLLQLLS